MTKRPYNEGFRDAEKSTVRLGADALRYWQVSEQSQGAGHGA